MKSIRYAIDRNSGQVFSFVNSECAIPVLDFKGMLPSNGWQMKYNLERFPIYDAYRGTNLLHTRKIPIAIKNEHRQFWGMRAVA